MPRTGVIRFTFEAGALVRGEIRSLIRDFEFVHPDVKVIMKEDKGILSSSFRVWMKGPETQMREFAETIRSRIHFSEPIGF